MYPRYNAKSNDLRKMILIPFIPLHLQGLELQETQSWLQPHLLDENYINQLIDYGESYSLLVDGKVIGCGGVYDLSMNRAYAWALVSKDAGKHLLQATKAVKLYLDDKYYRRIETAVMINFGAGHRWVKMLGFEREGTMKKWGDDGNDYDMYARVK